MVCFLFAFISGFVFSSAAFRFKFVIIRVKVPVTQETTPIAAPKNNFNYFDGWTVFVLPSVPE